MSQTIAEIGGHSPENRLEEVRSRLPLPLRLALAITVSLLISATLVLAVEIVARGSVGSALGFLREPLRPGWTTIAFFALLLTCLDALLGRAHLALMITAPLVLAVAFISKQKAYYLGDPLYPTDFLYSRQIVELLPLLVRERPWTAVAVAAGLAVLAVLLFVGWFYWCRHGKMLSWKERSLRLIIAVPALAAFASVMDYSTFSWARDRMQIVPIMWDQKENYAFNGFTFAFALNLPMANVAAPAGYSAAAIDKLSGLPVATTSPDEKPDIIIVMSESFLGPVAPSGRDDHARPHRQCAQGQFRPCLLARVRWHDGQCRVRGVDRVFECLPALWEHSLSAICSRQDPVDGDVSW